MPGLFFEKIRLNNGAWLLFNRSQNNIFAMDISVNFGSAFESKRYSGTSHFIEHMFFSGTKRFTRFEISKRIDSVGGYMNAFTSRECISYFVKTEASHSKLAIETIFDCFNNCQFFKEELETERKIIANEIRDSYDNPTRHALIEFAKICLPENYGRPITGTEKAISRFKRSDLLKAFRKSHFASNSTISISAPGDAARYVSLIEGLLPEKNKRPLNIKKCKARPRKKESYIKKDIEQAHICIGFPTESSSSEAFAALSILEAILGGGLSSRIIHKVREKYGLSYMTHVFLEAEPRHGCFCAYLATKPEKAANAIELVEKELREIEQGHINEHELKKAKRYIFGTQTLAWEDALERTRDAAFALNSGWTWQEYFSRIKSLTIRELKAAAKNLIDSENLCYLLLGPEK